MVNHWIVENHHLAIAGAQKTYHPMASDVYMYMDSNLSNGMPECENPCIELSNIRFSKIGSPVICRVCDSDNKIILEVFVVRKGMRIDIDVLSGNIVDQCIFSKEWFYITGNVELLNQAFKAAAIETSGEINFRQCLALRSFFENENRDIIEFDISESAFTSNSLMRNWVDPSLKATLYDYQKTGYAWMYYMLSENCGCILGDEMGLGKTLQAIAVMSNYCKHAKTPILVIAPVSLLENWRRECAKFAPDLNVLVHHGADRTGFYRDLKFHDVVIVSYNTAVSDLAMLKMIRWEIVIVDEAQNIKNHKSERAQAIKKIPREGSIAITGTPFENHITDIWSLVDFVLPGYLGTISQFKAAFSDDVEGATLIEPLLSPIMVRRLVADVAIDLPDKVIVSQAIEMSDEEKMQYEEYRIAANKAGSNSLNIGLLQKLRMYCTHPELCNVQVSGRPDECSVKYQRLCEIVQEIVLSNEKVIVFTSYKKMFDVFLDDIPQRFCIPVWTINGDTPVDDRQKIVDNFNLYQGSAFLALNPRAAGTGLNITGANHVIHYNLEWNPALEDQASARSFRCGQDKTVFVYRLYYSGTVEEIVNERIDRKRDMSDAAIVGNDGSEDSKQDIIAALNISPFK